MFNNGGQTEIQSALYRFCVKTEYSQRRLIEYNIQFGNMYLIPPSRFTAQRINAGHVLYACVSFVRAMIFIELLSAYFYR